MRGSDPARADDAGAGATGADGQLADDRARVQRLSLGRADADRRRAPAAAPAYRGACATPSRRLIGMKHLFDPEGRRALQAALQARPLLAFDFDGTLAPIVERADDARVAAEDAQRLDALSRLRPVAVVTGRSVADVTRRLGFSPQFVVGNHGAEDPGRVRGLDVSALDDLRGGLAAQAAEL